MKEEISSLSSLLMMMMTIMMAKGVARLALQNCWFGSNVECFANSRRSSPNPGFENAPL